MRQQGRSEVLFPLCPSLPLQLSGHLYFPWLPDPIAKRSTCHRKTIRHPAVTSHSLLWTSHVTSPLFFSLSPCLLFCYSLARSVSSMCPLPPCVQSGVWFTSKEIRCLTLKAEQRQGHIERYLQAVSHWLTAHPRPHRCHHDGFCQMLSCCFTPCATCFIHMNQR